MEKTNSRTGRSKGGGGFQPGGVDNAPRKRSVMLSGPHGENEKAADDVSGPPGENVFEIKSPCPGAFF